MAHSPETPDKFVCIDCQVMHAGTVTEHRDTGHSYEAPAECGCCGATEFVAETSWPRQHD